MSDLPDNMGKPLAKTFVVCGVVIEKDGKYLLVQEKQPKAYGKWNLPGGKVDEGETLEQAAVREAKEECGYDVELTGRLTTLHQSIESPVLHAFGARIMGGSLQFPEYEILAADWFSYDDVMLGKVELRNEEYIRGAIEASKGRA